MKQIKSQRRVRNYGEVYTDTREVNAMISLVAEEIRRLNSNVLEPACGNGNFLEAIMKEKLKCVDRIYKSKYEKELYAIQAISHIYGIDIIPDNVNESRTRLLNLYRNYIESPSKQSVRTVKFILSKNIQCGDTLACKARNGAPIVIAEWQTNSNGIIIRKDFHYEDIVNGIDKCYNIYKYTWMMNNVYELGVLKNE